MTDLMDERRDRRMDQRLARAANRWQAEQASAPAVPLEQLDEPLPRRVSLRAAVGVAAAVTLIAAGGSVALVRAVGDGSSGTSGQPTSTPAAHGTQVASEAVPWRDLKATHPQVGHRVHHRLVTPYDGLVATGHISGSLHPGDTLRFTVTLLADHRISLHPCPDYTVTFGRKGVLIRGLNCTQVPYYASVPGPHGRMSDFWPTLPANIPVTFAMQMKVPDERGRQKVLWTLDGPQQTPGFYGIVRVTAP